MIPASEWDRCAPWIAAALELDAGSHTIDDVRELCETSADVRFFPGRDCALVVEIYRFPRRTRCHLWLCAGDLTELVGELLPLAETWAADQGCTQVTTASPRKGWDRILAPLGFHPAAMICMKELTA
jgi:hypothetical protein